MGVRLASGVGVSHFLVGATHQHWEADLARILMGPRLELFLSSRFPTPRYTQPMAERKCEQQLIPSPRTPNKFQKDSHYPL